jgi:hypothetical protein
VDSAGIEPKQMLMGLARMSVMLSGKMTSFDEAIELHEEPWIPPLPGAPIAEIEIWTAHRGLTLMVYLFDVVESKAKNSKVAHEHTKHREGDEFILVRTSRE